MRHNYMRFSTICMTSFVLFGCLQTPDSSKSLALPSSPVELNTANAADVSHVSNNPYSANTASVTSIIKANNDSQQGDITWLPCTQSQFSHWFTDVPPENVEILQCATLNVPISLMSAESQSEASNKTVIQIAMTRLPATGSSDDKLGTLINIAGGPGESMVGSIPTASEANDTLSQYFDIISYAPRGIAPSTPIVKCKTEVSELDDEWSQSYVDACWQQTPNDLLKALGSDYAVTDIEAIRQAVGEPKISLIAYSYGTHIGTLYAEKYPEHLRAGVLDGLINLKDTPLESTFNQHAMMQKAFEDFVAYCQQDSDCYYADTKTIKEAEAKMARLFQYIEDNDIRDSTGGLITPFDLTLTVSTFLSMPAHWDFLNTLLILMDAGEFEAVSDLINELNDGMYNDAFGAISCANKALGINEKSQYIQNARLVDEQSTWDNYRYFEDKELLDPCYYWPVAGSDVPHIPKLSPQAPPLLLVAQTADFNTPYRSALAMQKYLDATLITRDNNGHVISLFGVSECVDNKVVDYLLDPVSFDKREADNLVCD